MARRELISSYDQPIILGLTPWNRTQITFNGVTDRDWPPYVDGDRLQRYDEYTALIENRPQDVFADLQPSSEQRSKVALALALPELLASVWADSVWSDPPTIELPTDAVQGQWDEIDQANDFTEIGAWESVFGAAGWGQSILYLRRDEERTDRFDTDVVIEEIRPEIFFPILKTGNARIIEAVVLAWEENRGDPDGRDDLWQVRERHELLDGQYVITLEERKTQSGLSTEPFRRVSTEEPAGVSFLPFVDLHAKRWRGRYWGVSELSRVMTLIDEIDNSLSNIAEVLEYHGKPMLQVPASVMYPGTVVGSTAGGAMVYGGSYLVKGADKTIGIRRPEEADIARYITFDGQLDPALQEIDRLVELALMTSEVPRSYFGLGPEVSAAPSGVSLKLQLQNYLKKAARWQRNESQRLRTLIPMALALQNGTDPTVQPIPEIMHGSPLPADDEQQVRIVEAAVTAKLMSRESGVRVMKRLGYIDDVEDELAAIDQDREDSIAALPAPMRNPGFGNSSTDPNRGEEPPA